MNGYEYQELGRQVAMIGFAVMSLSALVLVASACLKVYGCRKRRYWGR